MTVILLVAAIVAAGYGIWLTTRETTGERRALDDRRAELDAYREHTMEMLAGFTDLAVKLSTRETDDTHQILRALTSDRDRLVTALLAASGNPSAAVVVGRVDEALARAIHPEPRNVGDLLEESLRDRANDFRDDAGNAITPVGMAGS